MNDINVPQISPVMLKKNLSPGEPGISPNMPIKVSWERSEMDPDEDTELLVLTLGNIISTHRKASPAVSTIGSPDPWRIMSFESAYVEEVEEKEDPKKRVVVPPTSLLFCPLPFPEQEAQMHTADKFFNDTETYDTRIKLEDHSAAYVQPAEKANLATLAQGEDAIKFANIARLSRSTWNHWPPHHRALDCPSAIAELWTTLNE
ncbi:hypothetical protein OG21DRAFT_1483909 [Imleria badia]|nr:hypothetical protein OG21DRAFT_1483909 [Imleria badia]